jgi:hypothetical protein
LGLQNQPGTNQQQKTRFQYKAKPNTLGIWFSLARYPGPVLRVNGPTPNGVAFYVYWIAANFNCDPPCHNRITT